MNVANYLAVNACRFPSRTVIYHGDLPVHSYASLARVAQRWAAFFCHEAGLLPGDRVALFLPNSSAYIELLCGAWYAGLVVVPINYKLSVSEVSHIVEDSGSRIVFTEHDEVAQAFSRQCYSLKRPLERVATRSPFFVQQPTPLGFFTPAVLPGNPKGRRSAILTWRLCPLAMWLISNR